MKLPQRPEIYQVIDRLKTRDPELYEELRGKATEPADSIPDFAPGKKAQDVLSELKPKAWLTKDKAAFGPSGAKPKPPLSEAIEAIEPAQQEAADALAAAYERRTAETIVRPNARPVLEIRDNSVTTDFLGPDSAIWAGRIDKARAVLDAVVPAIGRIELKNNPSYPWVGTGWLVSNSIVVTNRHVAREFGRGTPNGFVFRTGVNGGPQTAHIDFLEEYDRSASLEFEIESILWIAKTEPDVAFLRVKPAAGRGLATPIPLAGAITPDDFVVTIGYPARDPRVPDQNLVRKIFGDVYEKKRLAPGQVVEVNADELQHDCSTLGGNSGSPVINLHTGEAVGLHFSGLFLEANYAVPAPRVRALLEKAERGELPGMKAPEIRTTRASINAPSAVLSTSPGVITPDGSYTVQLHVPIQVTVRVGTPVFAGVPAVSVSQIGDATIRSEAVTFDAAVNAARQALSGRPDVLLVRGGYRFKRGWITDERVIVVEVRQKLAPGMLSELSIQPLPPQILGFGVDVRTAALVDQLESLGISWPVEEALPKAGQYREPPDLALVPVEEDMDAIFHISPDSGWPNLRDFIGRVKRSLTATMYEWNAPHVSDAIEAAIKPRNRKLKMVTQLRGTAEAVSDMESRLGSTKFEHAWASVGAGKLIPNAYHIKVASRDGEEFWLSSGNWKDSNQPNIDPAGEDSDLVSPLRKHNRDWHAVIANKKLATVFHKYIEWDFEEAERVPVDETVVGPLPELFVPVDAIREGAERRIPVQYLDPLVVKRKLYVHPFLTPDRDDRGRRVFIEAATKLVKRATRKLYVQNQSFNLLAENVDEFEQLLAAIAAKQEAGLDVRIIFRDSREFSAQNSEGLQRLLERLKDFGFDTDLIRVQKGCHTKAFIIDPPDGDARDSGEVLFGSHNLTNAGALYNRDASLLIKDAEVAAYFEKAFMFDWEVLATQDADELIGGVRLAGPHEETPPGFERVSLSELLGEA